jgi:hypothetical protein
MALQWGTTPDGKTAVHIETDEDMRALRDHADFHEGALSILTFPTAPAQGFLSHDIPRAFGGIRFMAGATITKDEAANFGFVDREEMIPA